MNITNVNDFLSSIKKVQEIYGEYNTDSPSVYFRGQTSNKFKNINSSISRNKGFIENEERIYTEIINNKLEDFKGCNTIFEKLTKMQHYGLPTRLIDLTKNPLIALFFAVENLDNKEDGEVFVLIKKTSKVDSLEVRLNSLLAITNNYDLDNIKNIYYSTYGGQISDKEIVENISQISFVEYNNPKTLNERLDVQDGSFCICGNEVENSVITNRINFIEKTDVYNCINIQYEYKKSIKQELDEKYGINYGTVYPELQSFANHLKNKYIYQSIELERCYYIKKAEELDKNSISIIVVLKERLDRENIEKIILGMMYKYNINYNKKILIFVANNESDIIYSNWLVQANWINNNSTQFNKNNIHWKFSSSTEKTRDFYNENIIEKDNDLFIYINNQYNKIKFLIDKILCSEEVSTINKISSEYSDFMRKCYQEFTNDCGLSIDEEFNEFIQMNINLFSTLDDIINFKTTNKIKLLEEENKKRNLYFNDWKYKLEITDCDLKKDISMKGIKFNTFKPTIPINKEGIKVFIQIDYYFNDFGKLIIKGNTNLYDGGELMISIDNKQYKYYASSKCIIHNTYFETDGFTNKGCKLKDGTYEVEITLSNPNVQENIDFLKKAGLEYENLLGDFIIRDDKINVCGKYKTNLSINKY